MRRLLPLVALGLLAALTGPARAHSYADPALRSVLDDVRPALPAGVTVAVVPSVVDELVLANPTAVPLEVLGRDGLPFLRVSSAGVQADVSRPDWLLTAVPEGAPVVAGSAPSRWVTVSSGSTWSEFDPRLHPQVQVGPDLRAAGVRRVLATWSVPLRYGGQPVAAEGHVLFDPVRGGLVVAVTSQPAQLQATALQGELPGLFLRVAPAHQVDVLGRDGRPFLRLAHGVVEVERSSPTWRDDQAASGRAVVGAGWQQVARGTAFSWLDARLRYPRDLPPEALLGRTSVVLRWSVPVVVDGHPQQLAGTVTWVPRAVAVRAVTAPPRRGPWPWVALAALPVAGLILFRARGRSRSSVEEEGG